MTVVGQTFHRGGVGIQRLDLPLEFGPRWRVYRIATSLVAFLPVSQLRGVIHRPWIMTIVSGLVLTAGSDIVLPFRRVGSPPR